MSDDLKRKIESILFAAGRAVSLKELQSLIHINEPGLVKETIRELKQEYDDKQSSMMVLSEGDDAWKLTVREGFLPLVRKINPHTELSKTILETLAVIAWKQPALQSDVIKIRTNKAYDHITELVRLGFVAKERHGRSYLVKVTQKFLDYFDLQDDRSIKDVFKDFKDIEVAVQKRGKKISTQELEEGNDMKKEDKSGPKEGAEGAEVETYVDALPPMDLPKKKTELETYIDAPEGEDKKEEEAAAGEREEKPEPEEEEGEKEEAHEETPEEKARRIARELVEEDKEKEKKETADEAEKKLHPELEEFIAGAEKDHAEAKPEQEAEGKPGEEVAPEEEKTEEKEEESAEEPAEGQTESVPEPAGPEEESAEGKPKPAEEYPGQFEGSKEDAEKDVEEEK